MKLHQSGNEIIATELRPMSEFPKVPEGKLSVYVLVFLSYTDLPIFASISYQSKWDYHEERHGLGWLPMPQYRPELKQTKEDIHHYYGA